MLLIPAVDIKGGLCVRLTHGDPSQETVYGADPVEMARRWESEGARRVHVVDLDAAFGTGSNLEVIFKIKKALKCEVQMGGGLRSLDVVRRVMDQGLDRAVIGTAIFKEPAWVEEAVKKFGEKLVAGLDARDGEVKVQGWREGSGLQLANALMRVENLGFQEVVFTDISKDGALGGPAMDATRQVIKTTRLGVYASGGVTTLEDLKALKNLEREGLRGCIVGKALYDGRFQLKDALALC